MLYHGSLVQLLNLFIYCTRRPLGASLFMKESLHYILKRHVNLTSNIQVIFAPLYQCAAILKQAFCHQSSMGFTEINTNSIRFHKVKRKEYINRSKNAFLRGETALCPEMYIESEVGGEWVREGSHRERERERMWVKSYKTDFKIQSLAAVQTRAPLLPVWGFTTYRERKDCTCF